MSGSTYRNYSEKYGGSYKGLTSDDEGERNRASDARRARVAKARVEIDEGRAKPAPVRDAEKVFDRKAVKKKITSPSKDAKRLHIVLIDNSGSNRRIAQHLRSSSGYLLGLLGVVDGESETAWIYFSDHGDGDGLMQEIDYVQPNEGGDKVLHSTLRYVHDADGDDAPEAIECALWRACDLDFGGLQKKDRHLYLVTDVVAHGMGMRGDSGCPEERGWKESVERVTKTFGSFTVIGCGNDAATAKLQTKFLKPERVAYDLIDLSAIDSAEHRMRITGNALLFLIARNRGAQSVEGFMMALYEKWLSEPIFGANTDLNAQEAIRRFGKYLEIGKAEIEKLMERVFA